jgi:hypothetical protein
MEEAGQKLNELLKSRKEKEFIKKVQPLNKIL